MSEQSLEDKTEAIYKEIRDLYCRDDRPWIVGYSGGKDSTCALQLVWNALEPIADKLPVKTLYVVSSDTLVETPIIVERLDTTLAKIADAGAASGMSVHTVKVRPIIKDSFWVNLIGKGYPAPTQSFRWCTSRMKIDPTNRFIRDQVGKHGEVVLVLGVRSDESATRAQVMSLHQIKGTELSKHTSLNSAYVYAPIKAFSTDDVWDYLLANENPWGSSNRHLLALYKNANAGECPLVIDKTTPSCGTGRFGCWTCTVVTKDKAMEAMVENGEDWMEPMLEFRDFLAETQSAERKRVVRDFRRKNGRVYAKTGDAAEASASNDQVIRGPYRIEFCHELLERLLATENSVRREGPDQDMRLITDDELREIRRIWRIERQDWSDRIVQLCADARRDVEFPDVDEEAASSRVQHELLQEICAEEDVPVDLVKRLLDIEREFDGIARRHKVFSRIDSALGQEWREEQEYMAATEGDA